MALPYRCAPELRKVADIADYLAHTGWQPSPGGRSNGGRVRQNTNAALAILLLLDKTEHAEGTVKVFESIWIEPVQRNGEVDTVPRGDDPRTRRPRRPVSAMRPPILVATVDVSANPATTQRWGVTEPPTSVLLNRGIVERVLLGVRPADRLVEEIEQAVGPDIAMRLPVRRWCPGPDPGRAEGGRDRAGRGP